MDSRPIFIASDIHLGATAPEQEKAFLTWLADVPDVASRLILNGDLFDFWFEYPRAIPPGHERSLSVLREAVDAGLPITLMGGNHDWWGGRYLEEEIGLEFLRDPVVRDLNGFRTLIAHGDGLDTSDLAYQALRVVLRSRLTRWAFGQLGPKLGGRVAGQVSQTEKRWVEPDENTRRKSRHLEEWAATALADDPTLDLVVLGHTHLPVLSEVEPSRWYANSGDWVFHRTFVALTQGQPPELREWRG